MALTLTSYGGVGETVGTVVRRRHANVKPRAAAAHGMSQSALREGRGRMAIVFIVGLVAALAGNALTRFVTFLGSFGAVLATLGGLAALYGFVGFVVWLEAPRAARALAEPDEPA